MHDKGRKKFANSWLFFWMLSFFFACWKYFKHFRFMAQVVTEQLSIIDQFINSKHKKRKLWTANDCVYSFVTATFPFLFDREDALWIFYLSIKYRMHWWYQKKVLSGVCACFAGVRLQLFFDCIFIRMRNSNWIRSFLMLSKVAQRESPFDTDVFAPASTARQSKRAVWQTLRNIQFPFRRK